MIANLSIPICLTLGVMMAGSGCGRKASPSTLAVEKVPQAIESAFKHSSPEASQAASETVAAVRSEDPGALTNLQDLTARSDLSEEQRMAANRALNAYLQKLRAAAEKGDKKSEEAIEHYRATK